MSNKQYWKNYAQRWYENEYSAEMTKTELVQSVAFMLVMAEGLGLSEEGRTMVVKILKDELTRAKEGVSLYADVSDAVEPALEKVIERLSK